MTGPYGQYGRPNMMLEAYKDWRDDRLFVISYASEHGGIKPNGEPLTEADSKADFPEFLFGPVRTSVWHGYDRIEGQWRKYAVKENAPDFRERRMRGLNAIRGVSYVGDHGTYPTMRRTERPSAALFVDTYGGEYGITRQAIINDDSGELLGRIPNEMGRDAKNFMMEALIALIESNPNASDGSPFFSVGRGNQTVAPLSEDSLADAIAAMENQRDDSNYRIMIKAATLLVQNARWELVAKRILGSPQAGTTTTIAMAAGAGSNIMDKGTVNPIEGILGSAVREPFFNDTNNWYVFADPNTVPAFALGFLQGREDPFVGLKDPSVRNALGPGMDPYTFEIDSVDFKVRFDFGVAAVDPRGAYRGEVP